MLTSSSTITITGPLGATTTVISSNGSWYRYLCALIRLYLHGQVDDEWVQTRLTEYTQAIFDSGDPAARQIMGWVFLAFDEPGTVDHRARMAELATGMVED